MSQRISTIEWKKPEEIEKLVCYQSFFESIIPLFGIVKGQGLAEYPKKVLYDGIRKVWLSPETGEVEIVCWAEMPMVWTVLKSMEIEY